jgi:hypothetical protein
MLGELETTRKKKSQTTRDFNNLSGKCKGEHYRCLRNLLKPSGNFTYDQV